MEQAGAGKVGLNQVNPKPQTAAGAQRATQYCGGWTICTMERFDMKVDNQGRIFQPRMNTNGTTIQGRQPAPLRVYSCSFVANPTAPPHYSIMDKNARRYDTARSLPRQPQAANDLLEGGSVSLGFVFRDDGDDVKHSPVLRQSRIDLVDFDDAVDRRRA
jgi:hypothetical protein